MVMGRPRDEAGEAAGPTAPAQTAEDLLTELHREHYRSLVRLAALLLGDVATSEEVVQDAFVRLQLRWGGLRDHTSALAYLRTSVVNGARSQLRKRGVRRRYAERQQVAIEGRSAEAGAMADQDHRRVVAALRDLPDRQREALALKFYLDLSEANIAKAMGVSAGSVKTHVHRGLAALGPVLGEEEDR
jgi:RNA polymerase sigma-70 factor (sigma-E family)